ncbi:hypothetical protein LTR51_004934 [Lithohypha guttulata]|nr:hypothetical protein LTR51_004934 [Lithohypha guttulata]
MVPLIRRYSKYRRQMIWFGWPFCILGLVAGSFAQTLGALIFTQGIMYSVGFIIFYYPILEMVNEFWVVRRGMAYGLLCSASGVSGAAMPVILRTLLERYGYPTTLRATAVALFLLTGPLLPLLKGRLPDTGVSAPVKTNWRFIKRPLFWIYSVSNFAMGLGYFFPALYLPSYATSNGMSATKGALLLTLMSLAQVFGQLSFGYLSDGKVPLTLLTITSSLVAAIAVYTCWGLASAFHTLAIFALVYGFFGAGYTATWGRIGTAIDSEPNAAFAAFALLNFGKGIGNVLAGPIGGALLNTNLQAGRYEGRAYGRIVMFTGSCLLVSAATIVVCFLDAAKLSSVLRKLKVITSFR